MYRHQDGSESLSILMPRFGLHLTEGGLSFVQLAAVTEEFASLVTSFVLHFLGRQALYRASLSAGEQVQSRSQLHRELETLPAFL